MDRFTKNFDITGTCVDLEVRRADGAVMHILGSGGARRELKNLPSPEDLARSLPVFLGAGMGFAIKELLSKNIDIALVDKEKDLLQACDIDLDNPHILHVNTQDKQLAIKVLTKWQEEHGGLPFAPIVNSFYQRLDKDFYGSIREILEASKQFNFWEKAREKKFQSKNTKLLIITSKYFLIGELVEACKRLGVETRVLTIQKKEIASEEFVRDLLNEVILFKPDAILTLNHLGLDREGVLTSLLEKLELPLMSWFLDNPHLIFRFYKDLSNPWVNIFTWDKDNVATLKEQGFEQVFYLPLCTDPSRFKPIVPNVQAWKSDVSFVGNSMTEKIKERAEHDKFSKDLLKESKKIGADFLKSSERSISKFLMQYPCTAEAYMTFELHKKLNFEALLTWEATLQYRLSCVEQLLDFCPLILGDSGWHKLLAHEKNWRWHDIINYYEDLPRFYPHSTINLNCTSMQMKGAVNQRIFDAPATGSFVLTDYREQMDELFEPQKEVISYKNPEEIPDLVRYYLKHNTERQQIVDAARKRILNCHTWDLRVQEMINVVREKYDK